MLVAVSMLIVRPWQRMLVEGREICSMFGIVMFLVLACSLILPKLAQHSASQPIPMGNEYPSG
jgi:hypothetical protein